MPGFGFATASAAGLRRDVAALLRLSIPLGFATLRGLSTLRGFAVLREFSALPLVRFELEAGLFALGAALVGLPLGSLRAGVVP